MTEASKLIDKQIADLPDWRGKMIARLRKIIQKAEPAIVEEWKWGTGVWTHKGMICSVGAFKDHVKMHFFKGASLKDPKNLFNAGLDAKTMRAIDFHEGDKVNEAALVALVKEAVKLNNATKK